MPSSIRGTTAVSLVVAFAAKEVKAQTTLSAACSPLSGWFHQYRQYWSVLSVCRGFMILQFRGNIASKKRCFAQTAQSVLIKFLRTSGHFIVTLKYFEHSKLCQASNCIWECVGQWETGDWYDISIAHQRSGPGSCGGVEWCLKIKMSTHDTTLWHVTYCQASMLIDSSHLHDQLAAWPMPQRTKLRS